MTDAMPKSTSRKVNAYVKAVLALEAVRRKRDESYARYVRPLDRKRDLLIAEVDRRLRALIGTRWPRRSAFWASSARPVRSGPRGVMRHGSHTVVHALTSPEATMNERIVRTEKQVNIVEAHPFHRYISDDRPWGHAIVERAYDARCPRCREERAKGRDQHRDDWSPSMRRAP